MIRDRSKFVCSISSFKRLRKHNQQLRIQDLVKGGQEFFPEICRRHAVRPGPGSRAHLIVLFFKKKNQPDIHIFIVYWRIGYQAKWVLHPFSPMFLFSNTKKYRADIIFNFDVVMCEKNFRVVELKSSCWRFKCPFSLFSWYLFFKVFNL